MEFKALENVYQQLSSQHISVLAKRPKRSDSS